ncbi:MAG TPA: hypothetical protein DCS93_42020 [Microscillaceae bacterium]|nr:hypothetical protein [Microscillaceae bacterium]
MIISDSEADNLIVAWLDKLTDAQEIQEFFKPYPIYGEEVMTSVTANGFLLRKSDEQLNSVDDLHSFAQAQAEKNVLTNLRIHAKEAIALSLQQNQTIGSADELYAINKLKNREGIPLNDLVSTLEAQSLSLAQQEDLWKSLALEFRLPFVSLSPVTGNKLLSPAHFQAIRHQSWAMGIHSADFCWVAQIHFSQNHITSIQITQ